MDPLESRSLFNGALKANYTGDTCPSDYMYGASTYVVGNLTPQRLMTWITVAFSALTWIISLVSLILHFTHRNNTAQQKYMIRILLLPLIWTTYVVFCVAFYQAEPFLVNVPKVNEAIAVAALFGLFLSYLTPRDQRDAFFAAVPQLDRAGAPVAPSATRWFRLLHLRVMQFPVIQVLGLLVVDITAACVCDASHTYAIVNIVVNVVCDVSTFLSLIALIMLLRRFKTELAPFHPVRQLVAAKAVVFVVTTQAFIFGIVQSHSDDGDNSPTFNQADIYRGLPAVLTAFEMFVFCIAFAFLFSARGYWRPAPDHRPAPPLSMLDELLSFIFVPELFREMLYALRTLRALASGDEATLNGGATSLPSYKRATESSYEDQRYYR